MSRLAFHRLRRGASMLEYGLLIGLIGAITASVLPSVGSSIEGVFGQTANALGGEVVATAPATVRADRACTVAGSDGCFAMCPPGTVVVGGGGEVPAPHYIVSQYAVHGDGFMSTDGWVIRAETYLPYSSAYAICQPQ